MKYNSSFFYKNKSKSAPSLSKYKDNSNLEDIYSYKQNNNPYDRFIGIDQKLEKHFYGYKEKHNKFKKYNLNCNQHLHENYKYFQDEFYKTKKVFDFETEKIRVKDTVKLDKIQSTLFTYNNLYKNNKFYNSNAKIDFFLNYKLLKKIDEDYKLTEEKPDLATYYLKNCEKKHLTPRDAGIIRTKSDNLLQGRYGKPMFSSMAETYMLLSEEDYPIHIDLSNNLLQSDQIKVFFKTLKNKIETFNLMNNKIGSNGGKILANYFLKNDFANLEYFNLDGNLIGDIAGSKIIFGLSKSFKLKHLILNNNNLSEKSSYALSELLTKDIQIKNLELHYNSINGLNIVPFFDKLNNYKYLSILDLSWNQIGSNPIGISRFAEVISENKILYHLDISHNGIKESTLETLSPQLNKNFTLIGIHLTGNRIRQDIAGYLIPESKDHLPLTQFQSESLSMQMKAGRPSDQNILCNNWILEGWQPLLITCIGKVVKQSWQAEIKDNDISHGINLKLKKDLIKKMRVTSTIDNLIDGGKIKIGLDFVKVEAPVFVHFEFDQFKPWYIPLNEEKKFSSMFMVPPGRWKMFFTTQLAYAIVSTEYPNIPVPKTKYTFIFDPERPDTTTMSFDILNYNIIEIKRKPIDYTRCKVPPRSRKFWVYTEAEIRWTFPVSIWSKGNWVKDENDINAKTFENDWELVKERLPKAIKEDNTEREHIRSIMSNNYNLIRWTYKYWSSYSTVNNIWCISEPLFYTMLDDMEYFGQYFTREIPPILFRETITSDKNAFKDLSPPNGCVRHQFISYIVKAAARKYKIEPRINISYSEALLQFFNNYSGKMNKYDPHKWRWDRYYNEACDVYVKTNENIFINILDRYMGMYGTKPGEKPFFDLNAFTTLIKDVELNICIDEAQIGRYFNHSMTIHTNETSSDAHTKIRHRFEFIEAFARLVDECSYPSQIDGVKYPDVDFKSQTLGQKLWYVLPLFTKSVYNINNKMDYKWIEEIKNNTNKNGYIKFN